MPVPGIITQAERQAVRREFGVGPEEILIVGIGRLTRQKNFKDLVEALGERASKDDRFRCVVAGEGELKEDLLASTQDRGLKEKVTLPGHVRDVGRSAGRGVFGLKAPQVDNSLNSHPAHVVHVIGALQTGGAEKQLINYLEVADRREFRHTVLCLGERGDMADEVTDLGIPVVVRPVRFRNVLKDIAWLTQWFKDQQVAVIHSHMFYAALWSRVAGLRAGVPVLVTTEHGKELWKNRWQIFANRYLSQRTFTHIAVSEDVAEIRVKLDGLRPDKLVVIPNGVPIPDLAGDQAGRSRIRREFGISDEQPVFGTVGRVVTAKAYPVLLDAFDRARKIIPDLHWLQIGDGPDREPLMKNAAALGINDAITFAGRRKDISDLLTAMDVWVMSSIREGLPVSLLEAMAARKPILATRVGGIPDAVTDGVSALLVAENDPVALADGLIRMFQEKNLADNLAAEARQRAERDFGIEAVAGRIEAIYNDGLMASLSLR